jgi:hypothetical protein
MADAFYIYNDVVDRRATEAKFFIEFRDIRGRVIGEEHVKLSIRDRTAITTDEEIIRSTKNVLIVLFGYYVPCFFGLCRGKRLLFHCEAEFPFVRHMLILSTTVCRIPTKRGQRVEKPKLMITRIPSSV